MESQTLAAYPASLDPKRLRKAMGLMRSKRFAGFMQFFNGLDFDRHVLAGAGSSRALAARSILGGGRDADGMDRPTEPCALRSFHLGGASRMALACVVWEGAEPRAEWLLWRSDNPEGDAKRRCQVDFPDVEEAFLLRTQVHAAAWPHPASDYYFRSQYSLVDEAGNPVPDAALKLHRRFQASIEGHGIESSMAGAQPAQAPRARL